MTAENRRLIAQAFEQGRDASGIAAYHGTTLQVLKNVIETGVRTSNDHKLLQRLPQHYRKGDIFVYPIKDKAVLPFQIDLFDEERAFEEAKGYAKDSAKEHGLAELLGIDFQSSYNRFEAMAAQNGKVDAGDISLVSDIHLYRCLAEGATKQKWTRTKVLRLMDKVECMKGVILGYSQDIFDLCTPLPVDESGSEREAVRVINPPISSIVCVESLDQESYDYLSSLEGR